MQLARLWSALRHPVPLETRTHLAELWDALPAGLRGPRQMIGRQAEGCGALIGALPRCDFACTGCYLGEEANHTPPETLAGLRDQLRLLRAGLGRGGNLQITDGETTLRDEDELVALVRAAREHELEPMLMTHGDAVLRRPALLERLALEGGLREVCFHVDTTQRGRRDRRWREAADEAALNPLRATFAGLCRDLAARTGARLRVASTCTVTADNLDGVADAMAGLLADADVYRIATFLPAADVGRTRAGLGGGAAVEDVWSAVARGLGVDAERLERAALWFGHPGCSRVVMGLAVRRDGEPPRYVPLRDADDPRLERATLAFFRRLGGLTFRPDGPAEAAARALGALLRGADLAARHGPAVLRALARAVDPARPGRAVAELLRGRLRLAPLAIVTHHFMDRAQLETPEGRERVAACTFRVPLDGRLVSMCAANALGGRERYYAGLRARAAAPEPQGGPR